MEENRQIMRALATAMNRIDQMYCDDVTRIGVKASELWLLYALDDGAPHSQKQICQEWGLPKTTLNTTLKQAEAKGYLTLVPIAGKRRERADLPDHRRPGLRPPGPPPHLRGGGCRPSRPPWTRYGPAVVAAPGGGRGLLRPVPAGQLCQTNGGKGERRQPMRTFLRFLKPYRGLCLLTLLVMALDVAGALYLPTIVADMINIGVAGGDLDFILRKGGLMLGVALVSGGGTLVGCFLCARLSARIGRDMRNALYDKSLTFSASDFEGFGTGSMITRTLNDVNVVQQAFVWSVQMVLPVPLMCVIGVLMAFSIDHVMGLLLIGITLVVILGAVLVTRRASAIFARAQRFLDRISVVVRENITGARVIRAFNKATGEAGRMRRSFTDYAQAAIQANTLFFVLESLAIFFLNLCVVAILWLGATASEGALWRSGTSPP